MVGRPTLPGNGLPVEGWGPGLGDILDAGDVVAYTAGAEMFPTPRGTSFTVGPVEVKTKVRKGETGAEATARAMRFALAVFEAEFETKQRHHVDRAAEVKR